MSDTEAGCLRSDLASGSNAATLLVQQLVRVWVDVMAISYVWLMCPSKRRRQLAHIAAAGEPRPPFSSDPEIYCLKTWSVQLSRRP